MQYEIYLDKLFFMNMFFNCLILFTTKKIVRLRTGKYHILLAGMLGGLGLCSVFLLPFTHAVSRILYLLFLIFPGMISTAFWGNSWRKHIQAGIVVFGIALISGKLIEYVYMKIYVHFISSKYLCICITGFAGIYLVHSFGKIYLTLCEEEKKYYTVLIKYRGKEVIVEALYDTGNLLCDPVTGKYVHITDKETITYLLGNGQQISLMDSGIRLIPYHTIAKSGLMPVLSITEMQISNGGQGMTIKEPLLGISSKQISSNGRYHMILNAGELK